MPSIRPEAASCCSRASRPPSASRSRSIAGLDASSSITLSCAAVIVISGPTGAAPWETHGRIDTPDSEQATAPPFRTSPSRNSEAEPTAEALASPPSTGMLGRSSLEPVEQRLGREAVGVGEQDHRRRPSSSRSSGKRRGPRSRRRPAPPRSDGWRSRPPASTPPRRRPQVPPRSHDRRRPRRRPRSRSGDAARAARGRLTGSTCRGPGGERPRTADRDHREHPASEPHPGTPPRTPRRHRSSRRGPRRSSRPRLKRSARPAWPISARRQALDPGSASALRSRYSRTNPSRSPSSTRCASPTSWPVRWSLTRWEGCST